jgi:hypothetical protein
MTDFKGSIPVGMISICDLFEDVYQATTPDWEILEQRLVAATYYGADQNQHNQHVKDRYREAEHAYDQSRLRAGKRLRKKLAAQELIAQFEDPKKDRDKQISRGRWASMSDLEMMSIFETGFALVEAVRRPIYCDRKQSENVLSEIAPPSGDRAADPGESAPAASKTKAGLQDQIREINNQLLAAGFKGRKKERNRAIRSKFQNPPSERTIRRALKPD